MAGPIASSAKSPETLRLARNRLANVNRSGQTVQRAIIGL